MTPDQTLDRMIETARASDAPLDEPTRSAILDRVLTDGGDGRFVAAAMPATPARRIWARTVALSAGGCALAAAAGMLIIHLGSATDQDRVVAVQVRRDAPGGVPPPERDVVIVPAAPTTVVPSALETLRIAGEKNIFPDDATKVAIQRAGKTRLLIPVKLCVDAGGRVSSATVLKPSGFPAYDARLVAGVQAWIYRPYLVNGVAAPVCSIVQFVYNQK